jgi:hypothetical protein
MTPKIILQLLLGTALVRSQPSEPEQEPVPEYDPRVMGMGTEEEAFSEYHANLNAFESHQGEVASSNSMSFLYTFHSAELASDSMNAVLHRTIILPVMQELKGYVNFFAFDCQHPAVLNGTASFSQVFACDSDRNQARQPSLMLVRQPEVRKNPYTGEPMQIESTNFPSGGIDKKSFKKWLLDFLPDFSLKIQSSSQLLSLLSSESDINKVVLFTKKPKVAPVFKAAAAKFRDQLRFYVVTVPESSVSADLAALQSQFGVDKLPVLTVEQSVEGETLLPEVKVHRFEGGEYKLPELVRFLRQFAIKEPKEALELGEDLKQN